MCTILRTTIWKSLEEEKKKEKGEKEYPLIFILTRKKEGKRKMDKAEMDLIKNSIKITYFVRLRPFFFSSQVFSFKFRSYDFFFFFFNSLYRVLYLSFFYRCIFFSSDTYTRRYLFVFFPFRIAYYFSISTKFSRESNYAGLFIFFFPLLPPFFSSLFAIELRSYRFSFSVPTFLSTFP